MQKGESPSGSTQAVRKAAEAIPQAHAVCAQCSGRASCLVNGPKGLCHKECNDSPDPHLNV